MKALAIKFALFLFLAGWLVPLWLSYGFANEWVKLDVFPVIYGHKKQLNSFPSFQASTLLFRFALIWLSLVVSLTAGYLVFSKKRE